MGDEHVSSGPRTPIYARAACGAVSGSPPRFATLRSTEDRTPRTEHREPSPKPLLPTAGRPIAGQLGTGGAGDTGAAAGAAGTATGDEPPGTSRCGAPLPSAGTVQTSVPFPSGAGSA